MFAGEIGAIVAYTLIPVVVIRATNVIKSEQGKKKTQNLRGLACAYIHGNYNSNFHYYRSRVT